MRGTRNAGLLLLGIYLIIQGLILLLGLTFPGMGIILGLLALLAGILILFWR
jgi:hypothetical protein